MAGTKPRIFLDSILPRAPNIAVQIAHLAGAGGYDATTDSVLYGSDGATGGNLAPREAWAEFLKLPLTEAEFRTIANNVAPYMR